MKRSLLAAVVAAFLFFNLGLDAVSPTAESLHQLADVFVGTLDEKQKEVVLLPYESEKRTGWHFVPKDTRKGLPLGEMNEASRTAALRLLRETLSKAGYEKAHQIRLIEAVVGEYEGEGRRWPRSPDLYYVTLFGTPDSKSTWGFSFEGHHLSINLVCRDGEVVDSTPQFMGSHPATIPADYQGGLPGGTRILAQEEDLGFQLLESMGEGLKEKAVIDAKAPAELRFAGEAQPQVEKEPSGVAFADLTSPSQVLLRKLIMVYLNVATDSVAKSRLETINNDGWGEIHFAWAGAEKPGKGHYYRIRGKSFLIELVNTQPDAMGNPANHLHCNFRDLTGDFDLPPMK